MSLPQYLVVVGGSYVGVNTAQQLANAFHGRFKVLLLEKNSHFQHLFAFPRWSVTSAVDTHKAFIPYVGTFANCPPGSGSVLQASVIGLAESTLRLDRTVFLDGQSVDQIPYAFLIIATGTKLCPPSSLSTLEKLDGVNYLRKHAQRVIRSSNIAVVGGGAVGVQIATDIKELYPNKLSEIVMKRCQELGIAMKLGSRVKLPSSANSYPTDGSLFDIEFDDGSSVSADYAVICTGQTPQSDLIKSISPRSIDERGFIKTMKTLQVNDPRYPNIFAVGDVADTGAHKAAKPGGKQAGIVAKNIEHLLKKEELENYHFTDAPGIHLTLGITKSVAFGNPIGDATEPFIRDKDDGHLNMNIDGVWARRGGGTDYYL